MLSKSRLRRLLPGRRRNRKDDPVIQAVPISEEPHLLHDEASVREMPLMYSTQQHQPLVEPDLNIDYGRFQEAFPRPMGFSAPPSHHAPSVIAVPMSQQSQHYGERAITQLDYDGSQAARSENFPRSRRRSLSRPRSQHRLGSNHSSKAPDIFIHPPSIANMGEYNRSDSPDPLPVPPPNYKGSYRDDRAHRGDPQRHRSHRRRDYDRSHDRVNGGKPTQVTGDFPREHVSRSFSRRTEPSVHPGFQFSRCTGRKRAVCIGVNYTGQNSQLDGCVNDAKNVYHFLIDRLGFRARDIIRLTDEARDPRNLPTRANILGAMRWLTRGARKHDSLFFHYSGHGAQVRDRNGDDVDGLDEVIFPVDYSQTGTIIDDEIHHNLVKPLPPGCRLTAIIDSCHSGSVLDIPFVYHSDGRLRGGSVTKEFLREKSTPADVICWSGSADSGTAFGANEGGIAVGAMSFAFLRVLRNNPRPTYEELLRELRRATRKYHQKPQLSASHKIDLERKFVI